MMKQYILTLLLLSTTLCALAQPKWVKKARKAQINLITYDTSGQLLHSTNGFLIDEEGTVLTDYHSFKGAARAVAIDEDGKEWPVLCVAGASSLYDVLKVKIQMKKPSTLTLSQVKAAKGSMVYVMPYLSNKDGKATMTTVADVATFNDEYAYYTLPIRVADKATSCPVMDEDGEVIGLVQMAATDKDSCSYAISATYVQSLSTNAMSATSSDYRDIPMKKALPADATQANSFIYFLGTRDTAEYLSYVEDFILQFPTESNGYTMKAELLAAQGHYADADAVWEAGIHAKAKEDEMHYSRAATIYQLAQRIAELPETWTLDQALLEVEAALGIHPQPIYESLKAQLLYGKKRYTEACEGFIRLNQTNLRSADNFLYAAQCQQMLNDTTAALALQDSAVACFTKPYIEAAAPSLLMRAHTLISLGRYRDAIIDLNDYEHLKSNELTANFYYQREQAEMRCRMYQQALNDIERAVRMAPSEPLFHAELAAVNYRFGQIDAAIDAARAAIALDEQFPDAHRILGICLRSQGKEEEAKAALQRAIDLGDEIAKTFLNQ